MARFLSPEWFEDVRRHAGTPDAEHAPGGGKRNGGAGAPAGGESPALVLEQVVTGTPYGEVRYLVVVEEGTAHIASTGGAGGTGGVGDATPGADLTVTSAWETAVAIARGDLSAQVALMEGQLRIRGNLARLPDVSARLARNDPVPEEVRRATTY